MSRGVCKECQCYRPLDENGRCPDPGCQSAEPVHEFPSISDALTLEGIPIEWDTEPTPMREECKVCGGYVLCGICRQCGELRGG